MRVWLRPSLAEVIMKKYYIPHSSLTTSYSGVPSSPFRPTPTTEISNIEPGAEAGSFGATLIGAVFVVRAVGGEVTASGIMIDSKVQTLLYLGA